MGRPFRILSLSGGGVRGIYQAVFLKELAKNLPKPFFSNFDLICGTSTGAIVGLAIALDIEIDEIAKLYSERSPQIFKKKLFSGFRKGGVYDHGPLKSELENIFKSKVLGDCKTNVLITASSLTQSEFKIFDNFKNDLQNNIKLTDIILSSTSAPTYFPPTQITGENKAYIDGGLWANSPTSIGLHYAEKKLNIPVNDIYVLSVGTCSFKKIETFEKFRSRWKNNPSTIKRVIDLFFATQESYDNYFAEEHLPKGHYIKINSSLDEYIELDDVKVARNKLPALAEIEAENNLERIKDILTITEEKSKFFPIKRSQLINELLIFESGLSGFYPSRDLYHYRESNGSLESYINTAKLSVTFVSISLHKGINMDDLGNIIKRRIENHNDNNFTVTISLLNPFIDCLINSLAASFEESPETIKAQIIDTGRKLTRLKTSITKSRRKNLILKFHNAIPFGSAIMIDENTEYGKIQIETKAYKSTARQSFSFQVIPVKQDCLFYTLVAGYKSLIREGDFMRNYNLENNHS